MPLTGMAVSNGVGSLTIERPALLNALDSSAIAQAGSALAALAENRDARCILIAGLGAETKTPPAVRLPGEEMPRLLARIQSFNRLLLDLTFMPKPTVAVLAGSLTGITCNLALACDFRVAAEGSVLGQEYVKAGLPPHGGASYLWLELAGLARANEVLLTAGTIDATQAQRFRLVTRVVPANELEPAASQLAGELARSAPLAIAMAKGLSQTRQRGGMEAQLEAEAYALATSLLKARGSAPATGD